MRGRLDLLLSDSSLRCKDLDGRCPKKKGDRDEAPHFFEAQGPILPSLYW